MTFCAMIAKQRTGTGALGSVLDQHPSISYVGEVFHHDAVDSAPNYFWFLRNLVKEDPGMILPDLNVRRFGLYSDFLETRKGRLRTVVDIKYSSLHHFNAHCLGIQEPPTLFKILRNKDIPVIHLSRRNHLKTFVSGRLAVLNNEWHARSQDQIRVRSLRLNPQDCLRFIKMETGENARVRRILENHPKLLDLEYAELFDETGEVRHAMAEALVNFLQVQAFRKRRPVQIKQTSDDLPIVVQNYDELATAFGDSPYAWMLERD
jgi:hypothetical protein